MSEEHQVHHIHVASAKRRFMIMILGAIVISLFLVYVSMGLYKSSGTSQLDLSRPGYDSAREETTRDREVFKGFSADGPINKQSLDEFEALYRERAEEALTIDPFSGNALSDDALSL